MSKILFLDTETNGLPRNWKAPYTDTKNWPRIVQLAWSIVENDGERITERNFIIKPDNWTVGGEAALIHGITTERAMLEGVPLAGAIDALEVDLIGCDFVVCHNVSFDRNVLLCEYQRVSEMLNSQVWASSVSYGTKKHYCTMEMSTNMLAIPGPFQNGERKFKWPKLDELYMFLFNRPVPGREVYHNAMVDVRATVECFLKMKRIKIGAMPEPGRYGYTEDLFSEGGGSWISEDAKTLYDKHLQAWKFLNKVS